MSRHCTSSVVHCAINVRDETSSSCRTTLAPTSEAIAKMGWEVLPHLSYSLDLAPSDYHLFGFVKDQLRGQRYETTEAIQKAVRKCLRTAGTEFYRTGIFKLPERWKKCVQRSGDYVEKQRKVCRLRWYIWFVNNKACYCTKKLLLTTFGTTLVLTDNWL